MKYKGERQLIGQYYKHNIDNVIIKIYDYRCDLDTYMVQDIHTELGWMVDKDALLTSYSLADFVKTPLYKVLNGS